MKNRKLIRLKTDGAKEFKAYAIGNIPSSFDKNKNLYFNQGGLTYIEVNENSFWNNI